MRTKEGTAEEEEEEEEEEKGKGKEHNKSQW